MHDQDGVRGPHDDATHLRDHWWWRPGWGVGTRYLTWHVTLDGQDDVHAHLDALARALADGGRAPLDVIPARWRHVTVSGLGFAHEVTADVREAVVDAVRRRLAALEAFDATLGDAVVGAEAVVVPLAREGGLEVLREALRGAAAEVQGEDGVADTAPTFQPHVSVAYAHGTAPTAPVRAALTAAADVGPVAAPALRVRDVSLIALHRDHRAYEWDEVARVPLGRPTTATTDVPTLPS